MMTRAAGCELYYEVSGQGPPVMFVHGFPLSGRMWQPIVERISGAYRCIVPDLRGHGRSSATPTADMARYADDLAAVLDADGERRPVVLVGLSMGGYIAFEFFRRHRLRVSALVLTDTRAGTDTQEARTKREETAQAVERGGSRVVADAMVDKLFAPGAAASLRSEWHKIMSHTQPMGVAAALRAMAARSDSTPTLTTIDCPVLIVVGEHDTITPPDVHREMHAAITGSRLEIIAGAGHMTPVEQPDAFAEVLTGFLTGL